MADVLSGVLFLPALVCYVNDKYILFKLDPHFLDLGNS
jgi:hypothetical protein